MTSEVMFYLALTFGIQTDPLGALARMASFVEEAARSNGIPDSLWMTLGVSDGARLFANRYASDGAAPTLYYSRDLEGVYRVHPDLRGKFSLATRFVVSEPAGQVEDLWLEVPQSSCLQVQAGEIGITPFQPLPPDT